VTASLLSSLFGNEVSANSSIVNPNQNTQNSQNMNLLQANVSLALVTQDKTKKSIDSEIDVNTNVNILSNNALLPATGPMDAYGGAEYESSLEEDISIYVVHEKDTVEIVAKLFDVSPDTIYSANDLVKGAKLKEGDVLLILPFSGVEHTVAKGETLQGIANKYKIDLNDILSANDLEDNTKLVVGEKLMVPGGDMLSPAKPKISSGIKNSYSSVPLTAGYFVNPVPGARKTRGIQKGHKGVDLAAPTGTPIHAAAGGTVLIARTGWNGGFGTYVVIKHDNGVKTLNAHMSRLGTTPGAHVSQGEVIGYVGSTGHSTGPHDHFEVIGAKNPF
jgi:LysM repeat protein